MKTRHHSLRQTVLGRALLLTTALMLWGHSQDVSAQWTTSGTNIYYNSGNVGVGTTSPSYPLSVTTSGGYAVRVQTTGGGLGSPILDFVDTTHSIEVTAGVDSTNGGYIGTYSNHGFQFITNNSVRMRIDTSGNLGIGTSSPSSKLHVVGDGRFTGNLTVDGNIAAKYQDVAEWVPSSEQISTGTVVVLDLTKSNQVVRSTQSYDTRVAGVISEQPGIALGEGGEGKVLVATTGRVRVNVDASKGPIHIGDLLVTSDVPGVAMKSESIRVGGRLMHMPGTLIGKALEPLERGSGKILVLLSLQ